MARTGYLPPTFPAPKTCSRAYPRFHIPSLPPAVQSKQSWPKTTLRSATATTTLRALEFPSIATAYYLANRTAIDAYLLRQDLKWAEGKRNAEPLPANLRERILRAREELHTPRPFRMSGFWQTRI